MICLGRLEWIRDFEPTKTMEKVFYQIKMLEN